MIVEQRIYTLYPGKVTEYLNAYRQYGNAIQEPILGRFLGYFSSEVGPLNQVSHMWAYQNYEERNRLRSKQNADSSWIEYSGKVRELIVKQENRIWRPSDVWKEVLEQVFSGPLDARIMKASSLPTESWIVEMETVLTRPDSQTRYADLCNQSFFLEKDILGHSLGRYIGDTGPSGQILSLWVYKSFDERIKRRAQLAKDPTWQAAHLAQLPLVVQRDTSLLQPIPFWLSRLNSILVESASVLHNRRPSIDGV